ncbi:hypothetical protein [Parafrankia elaeagni]|nr:hypothetical protein [Parafrankia elaeagni]
MVEMADFADATVPLGHRHVSMTKDRYYGRQVAETGAAAILEILDS